MALHITNRDADRLARQLAQKTGKGITDCLIEALQEKLDRLDTRPDQKQSRLERAEAAINRFRAPFQDEDERGEDRSGWGFGGRW